MKESMICVTRGFRLDNASERLATVLGGLDCAPCSESVCFRGGGPFHAIGGVRVCDPYSRACSRAYVLV